ncbi:MAG: hypothetical protein M3Y69_00290, partial [Verrucomicrobiota bacterium]|nr:hypothetical protein [Verrucomicrobiota bacterium]
MKLLLLLAIMLSTVAPLGRAQDASPALTPAPLVVPAGAVDADPASATRAWLESVPPEKKQSSDAYFEGGYWLILFNWLVSAAIALLLLTTRLSARMRDFAERRTRFRALRVAFYAVIYLLLVSLLEFPFQVYTQFFREHAYG